jgi:hypothetical protein
MAEVYGKQNYLLQVQGAKERKGEERLVSNNLLQGPILNDLTPSTRNHFLKFPPPSKSAIMGTTFIT